MLRVTSMVAARNAMQLKSGHGALPTQKKAHAVYAIIRLEIKSNIKRISLPSTVIGGEQI